MQTVKVSPKFQVVIPRVVRESLDVRPGQKMQVIEYEGRIELIPERNIRELRVSQGNQPAVRAGGRPQMNVVDPSGKAK